MTLGPEIGDLCSLFVPLGQSIENHHHLNMFKLVMLGIAFVRIIVPTW